MLTKARWPRSAALAVLIAVLVTTVFINAAVATALITLTAFVMALVGVAWQVSDNRQRTRKALSYSYFERWSRPEMRSCREVIDELLDLDGTTAEERWREWATHKWSLARRLQALAVYAFFEELAGQYNRGELDNEATVEYLGGTAVALWQESAWLIGRYRQTNANFCNEWKHMLDAISGPLAVRVEAGRAAADGCSPEQAVSLDFEAPPLRLSRMRRAGGR